MDTYPNADDDRSIRADGMAADLARWQFWIDVGGTFTDCVARAPDGRWLREKRLSTGRVPGHFSKGSAADRPIDVMRCSDPPDVWRGYRLCACDRQGRHHGEALIVHSQPELGTFVLDRPLPFIPDAGAPYELIAEEETPILAVRYLLGLPVDCRLPNVSIRLGTTRGTNALLTRQGARTALITTQGMADVLEIGYQDRPALFSLNVVKTAPLYGQVVEVHERMDAGGDIVVPLDVLQAKSQLQKLRGEQFDSLAICLLHAVANPAHELLLAQLAQELGFVHISMSHQVASVRKYVPRGDTTVLDAYLNPVLVAYLDRIWRALDGSRSEMRIMTSVGGLVARDRFTGKDSVLSGPAAGLVAMSRLAQSAGFSRAIGFDMGGTSTDVSRFDGRYERTYETKKGGVRLAYPMLAIETVAAGGGSICRFDGVKLTVGPQSAGADPGPACYGRGGPLTITDMNLYLGRLLPDHFPFPLQLDGVTEQLQQLMGEIQARTGQYWSAAELAHGFVQIANTHMSQAIRSISIAKGYDPAEYVLVCFGGAAPQHACAVARELGIQQVLSHPDASVLSALGLGLADVTRYGSQSLHVAGDDAGIALLQSAWLRLERQLQEELRMEGIDPACMETLRELEIRYRGIDATLTVEYRQDGNYGLAFSELHRRRYGYIHDDREWEIVAAHVEVVGRAGWQPPAGNLVAERTPSASRHARAHLSGEHVDAAVYHRADLHPGDVVQGPALIAERLTTTVLEAGWSARVMSDGQILLSDHGDAATVQHDGEVNPILLEVFNRHFAAIAEQMGITLRNTATSVNVKERLDFSCAIFTPSGDLVVNAPHIPVHLGAMGETVRELIHWHGPLQAGDVWITNDPRHGGSHLPDVTVITPMHDAHGTLLFLTASRAHHAEIGGSVPGSMPPFSTCLAEEGVLIPAMKIVERGSENFALLRARLTSGTYPSRGVEDNLSDVRAQVVANQQGVRDLQALMDHYSQGTVLAYMTHIQRAAEAKARAAIEKINAGRHTFVDYLDDGTPIRVAITREGQHLEVDFTGTGDISRGNFNANRAIVTAAVLYCLRCLIDEEIPLNSGVLSPVHIVLPHGLLNPFVADRVEPDQAPAVAAGNVETSQRVVDVVIGALGLAAASQGTMNNVLFGDDTFGYYETICGGAGATPHAVGASAVHTHMTNTRLTDPEVLESRFPVRLRRFAIRLQSGGAGRNRGGDGVRRELEFLRPLKLSVISQRRGPYAPYGLAGGQSGGCGRNLLLRGDGTTIDLGSQAQVAVETGDILVIETPGGGGFGSTA